MDVVAGRAHWDGKPGTIKGMLRRSIFRLSIFVAGFALVFGVLAASSQDDTHKRGRKYKAPPPTSRVEVTILRDGSDKPIENAAVVFHPMAGDKDKGNMELKTNEDGKAVIDVLPIGDTVRLQVIAKGFQTYGEDYKIDKAEIAIQVKLKRPGQQYSIYEKHDTAANDGTSTDQDKPANPSTDSSAAKAKTDGAASQPAAQPSQSQPQPK
jgi:hypothetical protein